MAKVRLLYCGVNRVRLAGTHQIIEAVRVVRLSNGEACGRVACWALKNCLTELALSPNTQLKPIVALVAHPG